MPQSKEPASDGLFPPTRWTLLEDVRTGGEGGERALEELCRLYWYPVYVYARKSSASAHDAEDLTQDFFATLLERKGLETVNHSRGRLRSFLLSALKNHGVSEYRKRTSQKRGGKVALISIDDEAEERYQEEPADIQDPEKLFELRWALSLLEEAMTRLGEEYKASDKESLFEAIQPFLAGTSGMERYADVGEPLGMSASAVQVAVHRLKKRYRRQLEAVVAETIAPDENAEDELAHILQIIAQS